MLQFKDIELIMKNKTQLNAANSKLTLRTTHRGELKDRERWFM